MFTFLASIPALTWLGLCAACLTTVSFVPQVVRAWRTRSTKDISLTMFLAFASGTVLWIVYGFARGDAPVIAANVVTLALTCTILFFKLRYG